MTDINKQIEEVLKVKVKNCNNSTTIFDTRDYVLLEDAINIVKNYSRWRKVSEELPEFTDEFKTINVKSSKGNISTMKIHNNFKDVFNYEINKFYIVEWKYID